MNELDHNADICPSVRELRPREHVASQSLVWMAPFRFWSPQLAGSQRTISLWGVPFVSSHLAVMRKQGETVTATLQPNDTVSQEPTVKVPESWPAEELEAVDRCSLCGC